MITHYDKVHTHFDIVHKQFGTDTHCSHAMTQFTQALKLFTQCSHTMTQFTHALT